MVDTVIRKRIEILVDTPLLPRIVDLIRSVDISGWSVLHVDSGGGREGSWQHDDVTGAAAKSILLAVANEAKAKALTDAIEPILESHGLLLLVGNVEVIRGDKF